MVLARWQGTVQDSAGNIVSGVSIRVRREVPCQPLVPLFSDREGENLLGNPFTTGADGFVAFHVADGVYRIDATSGPFSRTWRYVAISTLAEMPADSVRGSAAQFDESGTFTKPAVGTFYKVQAWGGGGSGGRSGDAGASGGGGGGAYAERWGLLSELDTTTVVTIGAGGASITVDATNGANGGNTTFGTLMTAYGGGGGSNVGGGGGGGGLTSAGDKGTSTSGAPGGGPLSNLLLNGAGAAEPGSGGNPGTNGVSGSMNSLGGGGGGGRATSGQGGGGRSLLGWWRWRRWKPDR